MATDEDLVRERIEHALSSRADAYADVSVAMLRSLVKSLSQLIGVDGVDSLLFRVGRRVSTEHPCFQFDPHMDASDPHFKELLSCLESQEPGQARAASMLFFDNLIDVLAPLIGAHLTNLIFKSALGGASAATSSKEQNDE